jgi:hypothetical protein
MCEPMGRREIFLTFSLLVEIEGHLTNEFVSYVYETEDRSGTPTFWLNMFLIISQKDLLFAIIRY